MFICLGYMCWRESIFMHFVYLFAHGDTSEVQPVVDLEKYTTKGCHEVLTGWPEAGGG